MPVPAVNGIAPPCCQLGWRASVPAANGIVPPCCKYIATTRQVCPAGWKPGSKSMKPGLDASMEYFSSGATESEEDPLEVGDKMVVIGSPKEFEHVTSEALAVVDCE